MIRPAVITDEISQDFEHALDVMLEYGVRHAELRALWDINVMDLAPEQLDRARRALRERGMEVCGIASPLFKCPLEPERDPHAPGPMHLARERAREEQLPLLERALEVAEYFGTDLIRVFSFWRRGPLTAAVREQIVAALRPAVDRAAAAGKVLGLENEHACFLGTGEETAPVLEAVDSAALRAVWDPGNAFSGGETPYPGGYRAVRRFVRHVHVKDAVRGPDGRARWSVVGEGEIDYRGQVAALARDGYSGFVSLETHYRPPSASAEEGSRACLEGLLRILREAGAAG